MRSIRTLILAGVCVVPAMSASAQMYPGQGITVNPYAVGAPSYYDNHATIHLHMPRAHHVVVHHHTTVASIAPAAPTTTAAATPPATDTTTAAAAPPKPSRHHRDMPTRTAAVAPPPAAAPAAAPAATVESGTGLDDAIPFSLDGVTTAKKPPPKTQTAKAQPPTQTASVEAPPAQTPPVQAKPAAGEAGMTKRGEILFTKSATDPAPAQFDGLKLLAGDLSEALKGGASRIQLEAFGGKQGDKGSDARRLSLKRALSIRQVLIDNGVPSSAIDVRAMGGADDKGPTDRVDVYVRQS
jgi:outer membrane protein OmpA-like peptidoglycan-associated protein